MFVLSKDSGGTKESFCNSVEFWDTTMAIGLVRSSDADVCLLATSEASSQKCLKPNDIITRQWKHLESVLKVYPQQGYPGWLYKFMFRFP
jgi:hypothetical protein